MRFEWDETKNQSNQTKHGIDFQAASAVFDDPYLLVVQDRFENDEERWKATGVIEGMYVVLVAHTYRLDADQNEEIVRIISARAASSKEKEASARNIF